jgi:diguanylate cyclase (GGDEF)-like protein
MNESGLADILRSDASRALLRFLFASDGGLDLRFLSSDELEIARKLQEAGFVRLTGGKLTLDHASELLVHMERIAQEWASDTGADQARVDELLLFMQELLKTIFGCATAADLFRSGFLRLSHTIEFDVAVAVMLEQNLDLYLSRGVNRQDVVNDELIAAVRTALQSQIPISSSTDVVIRGDFGDLETERSEVLTFQTQTLLRQDNRAAGILVLFRSSRPFEPHEQRILDIFSDEVAMVLGNIHAQEQIQKLADTDDLTGIWNKRYFRRLLPSEVERAKIYNLPLSLLLFDVDDFKRINDTHGHPLGDVVLSELCGTVRETLRPPDVFARFGGDEFAVILPHTDLWGARSVSERMIQRVRDLNLFTAEEGGRLRCSVSIGVATLLAPSTTADDLLARADERLYESKKNGKDRYSW